MRTTVPNQQIRVHKLVLLAAALFYTPHLQADENIGVGAKPIANSEVIFDGSREMLDAKWTYWKGPRFSSSLPIKWKIVDDPVADGTVMMTDDPVAAGGKYGTSDVVTKKKYRDFRLHIEFLVAKNRGNSGRGLKIELSGLRFASHGSPIASVFPDFRSNAADP
ncbi:MAG: DUF1080 domain-containing protein, partial [Planctomycetaceae bacterium]|nr:DUF1080 domain-containing protein [Planctomycetaceae bacterium]